MLNSSCVIQLFILHTVHVCHTSLISYSLHVIQLLFHTVYMSYRSYFIQPIQNVSKFLTRIHIVCDKKKIDRFLRHAINVKL